jgi:glycosyltransferase involved in cell wall biosynthesis
LATKDWVLLVDADERVSAPLRQEILAALADGGDGYAAYALPRLVYYLRRWWWRGDWYPDYDIRLFRRERATWGGSEPHEKIFVDGKVRRLKHPLEHYTYRSIEDQFQRINRYTSIAAGELSKERRRWRLSDALLRPMVRFFRSYILRRGFMDGFAGFYVATSSAIYVFLKYAKLWELELEQKHKHKSSRADPTAKDLPPRADYQPPDAP